MIKLYDYQKLAHKLIIDNFKQHKKVLLCVMAGGGKSITAGSFIAKYHKFYKFVLIVRKRDLVEQLAKDALDTFNLDYSIFMAGHEKLDLSKRIQVCSKDTMDARDTLPFEGEKNVVVIVDECDEYPEYQKEIIERYDNDRFFYLGMTATPFNGLDHFDVAIEPIKPRELLKRGILVEYIYKIPRQLDLRNVEIVNGEWKKSDIIKKLDTPAAIAESFNAWLEHGDNRQTLIFCSSKNHSKNMTKYINNYYGREVAVHCDADTSKEYRIDAIKRFKLGTIRFISNIRLFARGTNIIEIGCILDNSPTLRLNTHLQKITRGSRKNPIYNDCILIDIANNLLTNGGVFPTTPRQIDLTCQYKKSRASLETMQMRVCEKCFRAEEPQRFGPKNICPYCGHCNTPIKKVKLSAYKEKKLFMENASEEQIEQVKMINEFKKSLWKKQNIGKRYSNDIARKLVHIDMLKKYGIDACMKIKKSIGLTQTAIDEFENDYVPLGGIGF